MKSLTVNHHGSCQGILLHGQAQLLIRKQRIHLFRKKLQMIKGSLFGKHTPDGIVAEIIAGLRLTSDRKKESREIWQAFNMPAWVEGAAPISIGTGGWGYIVSEKCANKEAAWAFVEFMTSAEETGKWAYATGALPARVDALEDLEYDPNQGSVDKAISIAKDSLPYAEEEGNQMIEENLNR